MKSLNRNGEPAAIVHNNLTVYNYEPKSVPVRTELGVIFDGYGVDHHYTLLVRTPSGSVLINPNGGGCGIYNKILNNVGNYLTKNIQQTVCSLGGCGPSVCMIAKLIGVSQKTYCYEIMDLVRDYASRISRLVSDYNDIINIIVENTPADIITLNSTFHNCKWCRGNLRFPLAPSLPLSRRCDAGNALIRRC